MQNLGSLITLAVAFGMLFADDSQKEGERVSTHDWKLKWEEEKKAWKRISRERRERLIVDKERLWELMSSPCFLANPTEFGKKSKYGEFKGVWLGKKVYLKK